MKHLRSISRTPRCAQDSTVSLAAVFALIADILGAVALAVTQKENQEFPTIPTPTTTT